MSLIIDVCEMLEVEMRIYLRRRQARVTEKFLNGAQIAARFEQMGRKRMAQHVRVDPRWTTLPYRPMIDPRLDAARGQPLPSIADEQRVLIGGRKTGAREQPLAYRFDGVPSDRHYAALRAFAGNAHRAIGGVEIVDVQSNEFGQTEA
jgi:hypothetical protein